MNNERDVSMGLLLDWHWWRRGVDRWWIKGLPPDCLRHPNPRSDWDSPNAPVSVSQPIIAARGGGRGIGNRHDVALPRGYTRD